MGRAMPSARALVNRAVLRRLGLSASVAIALAGCRFGQPQTSEAVAAQEADLSCYWFVPDFAHEAGVKAAMADGILTDRECDDEIMPLIRADNVRARAVRRAEAIEAVRAASADTHPKDGDAQQAPLGSGAVAKPDAQTPSPSQPPLSDN